MYSRIIESKRPITEIPENQLILNVNGIQKKLSTVGFEFIMDDIAINNHSNNNVEQPFNKNQHILNTTKASKDYYNFTSTSSEMMKDGNKQNQCIKISCKTKKTYEVCFQYGKLRRRIISESVFTHKAPNNKICDHLMMQKHIRVKIISSLLMMTNTSKQVANNSELKKRCCRYHFKFYFKYFPVLQSYVGELLQSIEGTILLSFILDSGFIMSFIALICIFVSMIISRKLREETGNIILLHFCTSIFIQIILHILICQNDMSYPVSKLASISFQYFTLVEFVWTTVIAFIQYRRYVTVLYSNPNYSVLKISSIVYTVSAVPAVIRIIWDQNHSKFMTYLTFAVPQMITLIVNLIILLMISKNILCTKSWSPHHKRSVSVEAKVIFMLFLILDLGWIVAMLAIFTSNIIFAYIFVFSQSLQGFVLFFIFIIINKRNRQVLKKKWSHFVAHKTENVLSSCKKPEIDPPSVEESI